MKNSATWSWMGRIKIKEVLQVLSGEKYKLEGTNHKKKTCANMCHVLSLLVHVRGTVLFSVKNWY
jgi:hypothetical protein